MIASICCRDDSSEPSRHEVLIISQTPWLSDCACLRLMVETLSSRPMHGIFDQLRDLAFQIVLV